MRIVDARGDRTAREGALRLADANRELLGFFPAEAFRTKAEAGQLLVAKAADGAIIGYLLYRIARERASITHLCVAEHARRAGVAKRLLDALRKRVSHLRFIEARCRKNYAAHEAWMRLGFAAEAEVLGRGVDRKPITVFRYDLGHEDLFTPPRESLKSLRCAIDTNVVIGMQEGTATCRALLADWLGEDVEFVVTPEVRNDLTQNKEALERKRRLSYAASFAQIKSQPERFEQALAIARTVLPAGSPTDARHLARASSADVDVFLTTDEGVLQRAPRILETLDLRVLHPDELVREMDALQNASDYAPVKMAGTSLELSPVSPGDLIILERELRYGGDGERSRQFNRVVREGFRGGQDWDVLWVRDSSVAVPLGLLVGQQVDSNNYRVHVLRIPPGRRSETALMRVLARHLAYLVVKLGIRRGCKLIVVGERYLHPVLRAGLEQEGFRSCGDAHIRIQLEGLRGVDEVVEELDGLVASEPVLLGQCIGDRQTLVEEARYGAAASGSLAESRFWPLKLLGVGIRNYIVPIQPQWAEHLFDAELAGQGLFGADLQLGLARESIYYRSAAGLAVRAPARLLWYVSESSRYQGAKAVRACSTLIAVDCDSAHSLYRRYHRLGVWNWKHVLGKANNDPEGRLMALQFGQSECFEVPVAYSRAVQALGRRVTFQGPIEISEEAFSEIYSLGRSGV